MQTLHMKEVPCHAKLSLSNYTEVKPALGLNSVGSLTSSQPFLFFLYPISFHNCSHFHQNFTLTCRSATAGLQAAAPAAAKGGNVYEETQTEAALSKGQRKNQEKGYEESQVL